MSVERVTDGLSEFPPSDGPELNKIVSGFDQVREEYLEACTVFSDRPSEENGNKVGTQCAGLIETFADSIKALRRIEPDLEEWTTLVADLIVSEDYDRIRIFKKLTGIDDPEDETYLPLSKQATSPTDQLREIVMQCDDEDQIIFGVTSYFATCQKIDLNCLLEEILEPSDGQFVEDAVEEDAVKVEPRDRKAEITRAVGRNALDVAKIAAGVTIALWATRRRRPI